MLLIIFSALAIFLHCLVVGNAVSLFLEPFEQSMNIQDNVDILLQKKYYDLLFGCETENELSSKYEFLHHQDVSWLKCPNEKIFWEDYNKNIIEKDCKYIAHRILDYFYDLLDHGKYSEAFNLQLIYSNYKYQHLLRCDEIEEILSLQNFVTNCFNDLILMYSINIKILKKEPSLLFLAYEMQSNIEYQLTTMFDSLEKPNFQKLLNAGILADDDDDFFAPPNLSLQSQRIYSNIDADDDEEEKGVSDRLLVCQNKIILGHSSDQKNYDNWILKGIIHALREGLIIHEFDLSSHSFTDKGLIDVMNTLSSYPSHLKALKFGSNPYITSKGWLSVAEYLSNSSCRLHTLSMDGSLMTIDKTSMKAMSSAISKNHQLRELCFAWNEFSYLLDGLLLQNHRIERLSLTKNRLTMKNIDKIRSLLSMNTNDNQHHLIELTLTDTSIDNEGLFLLLKGLRINERLERLDLTDNEIGNDYLDELLEIMLSHPHLKWISLDDNHITDEGIQNLLKRLSKRNHSSLLSQKKVISLKSNPFSERSVELLKLINEKHGNEIGITFLI